MLQKLALTAAIIVPLASITAPAAFAQKAPPGLGGGGPPGLSGTPPGHGGTPPGQGGSIPGGGGGRGGAHNVPEIDGAYALLGIALLGGAVSVIKRRSDKKDKEK